MYPLKSDLRIPRGATDSMGFELFLKGQTCVGFKFNEVIPGRQSLSMQICLFDDQQNYIRDLPVANLSVVRNVIRINDKDIAGHNFDDIYQVTEKGLNLIKTLSVAGKTLGDYI